jgi:hypothetical protein
VNHDALAVVAHALEFADRADVDDAATGLVGLADARRAVDGAARREVRAGDHRHQLGERDVRVAHDRDAPVDDLFEVVRRDVGGHTDRDARAAVDQQVGDARRQDERLLERVVVVRPVLDGLLLDVGEELVRDFGHPDFGVPHGGGGIAVDAAEVALPVHQAVAHGEVLGHADDGVVDGLITVRVILADAVSDDAGALLVRAVPVVLQLVHREQRPAVHRFEAVAHVGQGPADDDGHGVVQIGHAHLVFDVDRDEGFSGVFHGGAF